jgi:hypothetical protein
VTLGEFEELCVREWASRGDVIEIALPEPSVAELSADVLLSGRGIESSWRWGDEDNPVLPAPVGAPVIEVLNPVTRSVVKVTVVEGPGTARVFYGVHAPEPVRVVLLPEPAGELRQVVPDEGLDHLVLGHPA